MKIRRKENPSSSAGEQLPRHSMAISFSDKATPPKTRITMEKQLFLKMYLLLLKMVIFHGHISFLECIIHLMVLCLVNVGSNSINISPNTPLKFNSQIPKMTPSLKPEIHFPAGLSFSWYLSFQFPGCSYPHVFMVFFNWTLLSQRWVNQTRFWFPTKNERGFLVSEF